MRGREYVTTVTANKIKSFPVLTIVTSLALRPPSVKIHLPERSNYHVEVSEESWRWLPAVGLHGKLPG